MDYLKKIKIVGARQYDLVKDICHAVKDGDKAALRAAAIQIARELPPKAILVPVPSHTGRATYTLELCNAIKDEMKKRGMTDTYVADSLTVKPHPSLCELKQQGKDVFDVDIRVDWISNSQRMLLRTFNNSNGHPVFLVDNVIDTGKTARSCIRHILSSNFFEGIAVAAIGNTFRSDISRQHGPMVFLRNTLHGRKVTVINLAGGLASVRVSMDDENPSMARIDDLMVHEAARGEGIGNELLTHALIEAAMLGARRAFLKAEKSSWIPGWCKKHGFTEKETDENGQVILTYDRLENIFNDLQKK